MNLKKIHELLAAADAARDVLLDAERALFDFLREAGAKRVAVSSTDHELAPESGYYFVVSNRDASEWEWRADSRGFFASKDAEEIAVEAWDPAAILLLDPYQGEEE